MIGGFPRNGYVPSRWIEMTSDQRCSAYRDEIAKVARIYRDAGDKWNSFRNVRLYHYIGRCAGLSDAQIRSAMRSA